MLISIKGTVSVILSDSPGKEGSVRFTMGLCEPLTVHQAKRALSPKFKRVLLLNKTPEFPFRGLNICVDFNLRDSF